MYEDKIKRYSRSNWENSYFGGYRKILFDHPSIKVPDGIEKVPAKTDKELGMFTGNMLLDIFLLKSKPFTNTLLTGAKIKNNKLIVSKTGKSLTLNYLYEDIDLGNLFRYYRDEILKSEIYFPIDNPEEKEKGKGKGSGKDEKDEKEDEKDSKEGEGEGESATKDQIQKALGLLDSIKGKPNPGEHLGSEGIIGEHITEWVMMNKFAVTHYRLSSEISREANRLLNTLDISFESEKDRVNSLRMGKLDSSKLAEALSGNPHIYYNIVEDQKTKPFSVCILMDESGSMGGYYDDKAVIQRKICETLYNAFSQIMSQDKIHIYGHSTGWHNSGVEETVNMRIYQDTYNPNFTESIENQSKVAFQNNLDGLAIDEVYKRVRSQTSDNILFIPISDGSPSGRGYGGHSAIQEMKLVIEKCRRDGFVTAAIGIQTGHVAQIYNYYTIITDLSETAQRVSFLLNKVVKTEFQ